MFERSPRHHQNLRYERFGRLSKDLHRHSQSQTVSLCMEDTILVAQVDDQTLTNPNVPQIGNVFKTLCDPFTTPGPQQQVPNPGDAGAAVVEPQNG